MTRLLWDALGDVPDRRGRQGRQYELRSVLGIALAAMLAGANDLRAIWRWGRQNAGLTRGKALGSFESWAEWCRDPLLALGCRDPVERMDEIKSDDPHRRQIVELFAAWAVRHGGRPVKAAALAESVQALVDPQGRGRQHIAARGFAALTARTALPFVTITAP